MKKPAWPLIVVFLLSVTTFALTSCTLQNKNSVYRVALRYIPQTVNPYTSQVNTEHFIMLQLYYPLFQRLADGAIGSEFLEMATTRAEDTSFRNFILCLRNSVRFSDGSPIAIGDLDHSLREAHKRQELVPPLDSLQVAGRCIRVSLKAPDPRYFEKLTGIASTITSLNRAIFGFPLGLGPYQITTRTTSELILEANPGRVKGSFKTIEFRQYSDVTRDYAEGVFDFNHTGQVDIPLKIKADFQSVSRPFFKVYALIVNYPTELLRRRFSACMPVAQLRSVLGLPLKPTVGFLPTGIQGSDAVKPLEPVPAPRCVPTAHAEPMVFFNYRPEIRSQLQGLLTSESRQLPIPVRYEEGSVDDLVRRAFRDDRFAAVISFDSSTSDSSAYAEAATFFESFIRESRTERLVTQPVAGLGNLVRLAAQSNDPAIKTETYRKAHQLLLDSGYVVPLGQLDTAQYYPKTIRNIVWSDRISGFPDISLMEAR